jgi:hypothetical protein
MVNTPVVTGVWSHGRLGRRPGRSGVGRYVSAVRGGHHDGKDERMTHPYFVAKADHVLRAAGGDPISEELAAWAEKARQNDDSRSGAVVTPRGDVVAVTRYIPTCPEGGATYVTGVSSPCLEYLMNIEVGLAMARMKVEVVHIRYSQVCQGPPPRVAD